MTLSDKLHTVGLTKLETEIYLYLLEHGISSPPEISRGTRIARSNAHLVLRGLEEKRLIKRQRKGKRYVYAASDPSATLTLLDKKREAMEEALGDLEALYKKQQHKPIIRFYEGKDELVHIFDDILKAQEKMVFGFASTDKLFKLIPRSYWKRFQTELKKRQIFLHDILSHASGEDAATQAKTNAGVYYEYRLLDTKYGDFPTDMLVWDDKVAIMTLEEPVFATVLENKNLADTYRIQFDLMWKALKRV